MRRRSSLSGINTGTGQVALTHNRLYDTALAVQRKQDLRRMARSALTFLIVSCPVWTYQ